jgi:hypothetical protein
MTSERVVFMFPSGTSSAFWVHSVPRVGEYVVDPQTQAELRVFKVIHTMTGPYANATVTVMLSME